MRVLDVHGPSGTRHRAVRQPSASARREAAREERAHGPEVRAGALNARGGVFGAGRVEWVHEKRRRTWVAARRHAQLPGHAWADWSAIQEDSGAQKELAEPAAEAQGERAELTAEMIGPRYGVSEYTGLQWTKVKEKREGDKVVRRAFPAPRSTQPRTYDQHEVDAWVEKHRPHVWAAFKKTGSALVHDLPEGHPRDLLDSYDFAEVLGMTTRGEALARETVRACHARGQVPFADRTADDGKTPRVFQDHWCRETVYGFVLGRKGSGRFGRRSQEALVALSCRPPADC